MEIWHGDCHDEEFFYKLSVLELRHLSRESATSTSRFIESLTNLEELVVRESYLEEPSSNVEAMEGPSQEQKVILPFARQIKHLKTVNVSDCDGLSSMFTPTIVENLVALTKLRISNCRILTEVISDKGSKEGHKVAFHHLKCMELDGLIELKCFSSGGCALICPLLEDVIVNGCPNMKFFSEGPIEAPKLHRVKVDMTERYGSTQYQYFWKENLNMTIQNMFEEVATIAKAKFVRLFELPELVGKWHNEHNPVNSSWQLQTLVVDKCPSFINAMPFKLMLVLEKMTSLQVRDCKSLEEIFDLEGLERVESTRVLPHLEDLHLINLPKLRQLWNKDLQGTMRFNSLSSSTLYKCSNLRHAFTPSMAWCLANIYHMEIRECDRMEGVIEEEEGRGSVVEKITFPNLWMIKLKWLPNLTSFLSGKNHALDCPNLKDLTIAHCPKMRSLTWQSSLDIDHNTPSLFTPRVQFLGLVCMVLSHMDNLSKIWPDNPQETLTFDSLLEVKVKNCKSLENLFPYWVATSLTQLGKLRVESCRIEEIVANGDDTPPSNIAQVLFPKLTSLVLHDMPRLKTSCPNLPTLNWQFLKEL
ncbi:disease resistance protein RPS2-like [Rhodamnia argentea]|uniref:Disease resistance protein RPS2-like n=1 Tax=Rhodamnia argentea TaxID=178133 RepID=A0ABM3HGH3_9MYRT|nr:disease resistance protein RPS2-like [Rhodamnia argentea]